MDFLRHNVDITQLIYGFIAICGGVARYLNNYAQGQSFQFSVFVASTFMSGFSGYMFALLGISMNLPQPFLFMMAGTGGFFGDQSMKLVLEYLQNKSKV